MGNHPLMNVSVNNTGTGDIRSIPVGATVGGSGEQDYGQGNTEFTAPSAELSFRVLLNEQSVVGTTDSVGTGITVDSSSLATENPAGAGTEQIPIVQPTLFVRTLIQR